MSGSAIFNVVNNPSDVDYSNWDGTNQHFRGLFNSFTLNLSRHNGEACCGSITFNDLYHQVGAGIQRFSPYDAYLTINDYAHFDMGWSDFRGESVYFTDNELLSIAFLPAWSFNARGELTGGAYFMMNFAEDPAPVPEPSMMLLLGSGLMGLAGFRRKMN